jgi:hypothetical protein
LNGAVGEVDEVSATQLNFVASSVNDIDNIVIAYKSFASGDIQACATVPDQANWVGYKEDFTGFGVKIQEGTGVGAWFAHLWVVNKDDVPRLKTGVAGSTSTQLGTALTLPAKLCIVFNDSESAVSAWIDDTIDVQVGVAVSQNVATSAIAGAFGTSAEVGQSTSASLTTVTATGTITVGSPAAAFTSGPTAGSPSSSTLQALFTSSQDGTVKGTACANGNAGNAAQTLAGNCASGLAPATISEAVLAGVADGSAFTGLTPSTTYDLGFVIDATVDSALASLADQTTDDDDPPPNGGKCIAGLGTGAANSTINSEINLTADVNCRDSNDTVQGWDFSMPLESVISTKSGTFYFNNADFPSSFRGRKLYICNAIWRDLQPTQSGPYDWSKVEACFTPIPAGYHGVMLNVRGVVAHYEQPCGTPKDSDDQRSAPDWMVTHADGIGGGAGINDMDCHPNDFRIKNLNLDNGTVVGGKTMLNHYKDFIAAFVARNYQNLNMVQIMHVASSSRGEECCGGYNESAGGTVEQINDAWVLGYDSANRWKLAWLKENPATIATNTLANGSGIRGGIIENWLRGNYLPGNSSLTGQTVTTAGDPEGVGHIKTNATSFAPVSELRHFADQNEECASKTDNATAEVRCYFGSLLRSVQMRRNVMAIESGSAINHRLDNWWSIEAGKTPADQPDGWVWLMRTYGGAGGEITNLERGILQLESLGATTPVQEYFHDLPYEPYVNSQLLAAKQKVDWARRENNAPHVIGFAIDDAWWATSLTHNAVFKVTFMGGGSKAVNVRNAAAANLCSFNTGSVAKVLTATCFVSDFNAGASGLNKDFDINADTVDVIFVRVIKNGGSHATW